MTLFLLYNTLFGFFWGSFLNVVIDRLHRRENFVWKRSKCESCNQVLKWYDLIPVFSYLSVKGKCRYCKSQIPIRLIIVEILTGVLFAIITYSAMNSSSLPQMILYLLLASCLIVIFFSDSEYGIIPDEILILQIIIEVMYLLLFNRIDIMNNVIIGLIAFMFFLLLFVVTQGKGMGFGDVKFAFVIGLLLGFPKTLIALYSAFLTGAFISVILILLRRKKFRNDTVAFGPFLIIGIIISICYGDQIISLVRQVI